jgi:microcystin-dependent protein
MDNKVKIGTKIAIRGLGEFSPIGWLFIFGQFFNIVEVSAIFGLLFPQY